MQNKCLTSKDIFAFSSKLNTMAAEAPSLSRPHFHRTRLGCIPDLGLSSILVCVTGAIFP